MIKQLSLKVECLNFFMSSFQILSTTFRLKITKKHGRNYNILKML